MRDLMKVAQNTNGLLRQYFLMSTDLPLYSQVKLDEVARQLNERPENPEVRLACRMVYVDRLNP